MAAANKPIWVQVAEAGFGDRLVELGWKQVSPAHWRLDGDGVIWRTMLGRAPEDLLEDVIYEETRPNRPEQDELDRLMANGLADETGFELAGLDDLIKRLCPTDRHRWLNPMIRRSVRVHLTFSIGGAFYNRSINRLRRWEEENPPRKASLWERLRYLSGPEIWSGSAPPIERLYDVEPAYRTKEESLRSTGFVGGWWDTTELGVEEVSARLARHWEASMKPEVDAWMTARDSLSWHMFTREDPDECYHDLFDVYARYIAGDLDYCRRRLRAEVNRKVPTLEEELAWLKKVKFFKGYPRYGEKEKRETAQRFIEDEKASVREAEETARTLGLELDRRVRAQ